MIPEPAHLVQGSFNPPEINLSHFKIKPFSEEPERLLCHCSALALLSEFIKTHIYMSWSGNTHQMSLNFGKQPKIYLKPCQLSVISLSEIDIDQVNG